MPTPVPAPFEATPVPAPAPFPHRSYEIASSSEEEEDSYTETETTSAPSPVPAPMPMPQPVPTVAAAVVEEEESYHNLQSQEQSSGYPSPEHYEHHHQNNVSWSDSHSPKNENALQGQAEDQQQQQQQHPTFSQASNNTNDSNNNNAPTIDYYSKQKDKHRKYNDSLKAAADLIHTLDSAYAEINVLNASSAQEADEARAQARTAAEIARRYTTRSHPTEGATLSFERYSSSPSNYKTTPTATTSSRAPMTDVGTDSNRLSLNSFTPSSEQNQNRGRAQAQQSYWQSTATSTSASASSSPRHHYRRTPPSVADRITQANAEDVLSLSLELERTKQKLEAELMSHDETKHALAEERARNQILHEKFLKIESNMEAQREQLGRTGDELEQELQRAKLRVEAAEEDADLALEIAKENAESRDQLEYMLQQALEEIQVLRSSSSRSYPAIEAAIAGGVTPKSSLKSGGSDTDDESASKRSVHFSDPISYSHDEEDDETATPKNPGQQHNRRTRSLLSAGRRILALARSNSEDEEDNQKLLRNRNERASPGRRQFLRKELEKIDSNVEIPSPSRVPREQQKPLLDVCRATTKLLQESGRRLELDGHWWKGSATDSSEEEESNENDLQTIARQYCQSVEVRYSLSFLCYLQSANDSAVPCALH